MRKINKYLRASHRISVIMTAFFVLMIFLFYFSQMIMETSAYSLMISKNATANKVTGIQQLLSYRQKKETQEKEERAKRKKIQKEKKQSASQNKAVFADEKSMATFFMKPVANGITTSHFGDTVDRNATHLGHDWAVPVGTNVFAAADGVVEKAYLSDSYGYNILVNHQNGWKTRYAHLSEILVNVGQNVSKGELIGHSGNTGDSTGPHLHFEMLQMEKHVNPLHFLED